MNTVDVLVPIRITYEQAKVFAREVEKKHRRVMRECGLDDCLKMRLCRADHILGRFTYTEVLNGEEVGKVIIAAGPGGKAKVVQQWHTKAICPDLHLTQRIKTTKSENKWKGVKS